MAAGDQVLTNAGDRSILSDGSRARFDASGLCASCCGSCTASSDACGSCNAGDTPDAYSILFSGVTLCTACHLNDDISVYIRLAWISGDAINTSHTITQGANPAGFCRWTKTIANAVRIDFYTDGTCGTLDFSANNDLDIKLEKIASDTWELTVTAGGCLVLYYDQFTGDGSGVCETVPGSTNALTGSGTCGDLTASGIPCGSNPSQGGYSTSGGATITCQ